MKTSEMIMPQVKTGEYNSDSTRKIIEQLKNKFSFLSIETIGKSVMGKPIECVVIGNGKKELSFNAAHHASEWITVPVLLRFLCDYADAVKNNGKLFGYDAARLFESTKLFAIPLVNPDGVDLAVGSLKSGEYFENAKKMAEKYPSIPFPSCWKSNINGVNLNLQYPAGWEKARDYYHSGGHTMPSPAHFVGEKPLSEPESKAMSEFTRRHNFLSVICLHTQGSEIFWRYGDPLPDDSKVLGDILATKSGYPLSEVPDSASYAGYKDWFMQEFGRKGYTIELGKGSTPLPVTDFEKIYSSTAPALAAAIEFECR